MEGDEKLAKGRKTARWEERRQREKGEGKTRETEGRYITNKMNTSRGKYK